MNHTHGTPITEDIAFQAIGHLGATDIQIGRLRAQQEAMDYRRKIVRADLLLEAAGKSDLKTAELRNGWAESHSEYKQACREHVKAIAAWESLRAQRQTWTLQIEMWRSLNASRRQGNI